MILPAIELGTMVGPLKSTDERQGANWEPGRAAWTLCANHTSGVPCTSLSPGLSYTLTVTPPVLELAQDRPLGGVQARR